MSRYGFLLLEDDEEKETRLNIEFEKNIIFKKDENILVQSGFLKKFGKYLRNDWNELVFVNTGKQYLDEISDAMMNDTWYCNDEGQPYWIYDADKIKKEWDIQCIIYNWDGAFWELVDCQQRFCEVVEKSVSKLKDIRVERITNI